MADDSCDVPFPHEPERSDNEHDFDSDDSNYPTIPGGATRNLFSIAGGEPHPHTLHIHRYNMYRLSSNYSPTLKDAKSTK